MLADQGRIFIGRFRSRADLLESLTDFCVREGIRLGIFSVIGALSSARLGYYDQDAKQYVECVRLDKKLEIASCIGNISLKDSKVFVHAHITLADLQGKCHGGHLMPGAAVFAAEYYIKELTGGVLERRSDPETGLSLWESAT